MQHFLSQPHRLYLLLGSVFGLIFLLITPPFGGPDEPAHFERIYEIATAQWMGSPTLPEPLPAFEHAAFDPVYARTPLTFDDYRALYRYRLSDSNATVAAEEHMKIFKIHNPLSYLPLALTMKLGFLLDAPLLLILYTCRLTSLLTGLVLVYAALRILPAHRYIICAIMLLPTPLFIFSMINLESLNIGLACLFFAYVMQARATAMPFTRSHMVMLGVIGVLLALCKTAYMFIPLAAFLIPAGCFVSARHRNLYAALLVACGIIGAVTWSLIAKSTILDDLPVYSTLAGTHVEPNAQIRFILTQPLHYGWVMLSTLTSPAILREYITGFLGVLGHCGLTMPRLAYALPVFALTILAFYPADRATFRIPTRQNLFLTALVVATIGIAFTLLYIQWNAVRSPLIEGFQGRYLLALVPWLLCWLPSYSPTAPIDRRALPLAFGCIGLCLSSAVYTLWQGYW